MTKPINYQTQAIPAYSGITINITNPTLNATPLNSCPQNLPGQQPQQPYFTIEGQQGMPNYQVAYPSQYGINTNNKQALQNTNNEVQANTNNSELTTTSLRGQVTNSSQEDTNVSSNNSQSLENTTSQNNNTAQTSDINSASSEKTNTQNIEKSSIIKEQAADNTTNSADNSIQRNTQQSYPPQYYLNNYNYIQDGNKRSEQTGNIATATNPQGQNSNYHNANPAQFEDMNTSSEIINQLNERVAAEKELQNNGKKTRVVALTNEYIMSLENYLNNPNSEIRLMAAKEVLTRLDEDKKRYDDAALNALLNKMLQDPNKLVRIAALSAFSSELASGNNFTVDLLKRIQANPNADKEDVLQAANILLKMSSITEIRYVPVKKQEKQSNNKELEAAQKQNDQLRAQLQQYKEKEIEKMLNLPQGK